jgi:hypothetical protein
MRGSPSSHEQLLQLWQELQEAEVTQAPAEVERILAEARNGAAGATEAERGEWDVLVTEAGRHLGQLKDAADAGRPQVTVQSRKRGRRAIALTFVQLALLALYLIAQSVTASGSDAVPSGFAAPKPTAERRAAPATPPFPLPPADVYVVPLGSIPSGEVTRLVGRTGRTLGVRITILAPLSIADVRPYRSGAIPPRTCIETLALAFPDVAWGQQSALIGVTELDLGDDASWSFASRNPGISTGVISTARLDPRNWGQASDQNLLTERFRTMLIRSIGFLYFDRPATDDRSSALHGRIASLDDLDALSPRIPR